jgi:Fe-S cluster assembly protein SufD
MTATTTGTATGGAGDERGRPEAGSDQQLRPEPGQNQHGLSAHSHGAGTVPQRSRAQRRASFQVEDFAVPTGREEDWRFTPLDRLHGLHSGA